VAVQDVSNVGNVGTTSTAPDVVQQGHHVDGIGVKYRVMFGNTTRSFSCDYRVPHPGSGVPPTTFGEVCMSLFDGG
jgi:hypothetical protein